LNLKSSKSATDAKRIKPKNIPKSFHPPIRLEAAEGKILNGIKLTLKKIWKNWNKNTAAEERKRRK